MENLQVLEEEYNAYLIECRSALRLTLAKVENLKERLENKHSRNLIVNIESRIKTFSSAIEKCRRKDYEGTRDSKKKKSSKNFTINTIRNHMQDVAGIRITTVFQDDIYTIYDAIKDTDLGITHVDDYIIKPKKNGYRSLHLVVNVPVSTDDGIKFIPVEVQIRDKAMDLWAAMDHLIRYKNPNPSPDAEKKFQEIGEILQQFDKSAIALRDFNSSSPKIPE